MTKVCVAVHPPTLSQGIHRIARALEEHAPLTVRCVPTWQGADLILLHTIGIVGMERAVEYLQRDGQAYAIFQYCLKTAGGSQPEWDTLWGGARLVVSYYNLDEWFREFIPTGRFLRTPLGVDTTVFTPCGCAREYLVGTSGYVADQESVNEWAAVAGMRGLFHLGPEGVVVPPAGVPTRVVAQHGMSDAELAKRWSRCTYVSGLRRVEGFELPAFEGLACGARPVMYDREDATHWMGEHAEYIREGEPADVIDQLRALISRPNRPVTPTEREWVRDTFHWTDIARRFWEAVL